MRIRNPRITFGGIKIHNDDIVVELKKSIHERNFQRCKDYLSGMGIEIDDPVEDCMVCCKLTLSQAGRFWSWAEENLERENIDGRT